MGLILEDLYGHEGYADRRLADGRLAGGSWSRDTLQWTAYVAACGCGWHGSVDYPPTDEGEEVAVDQWHRDHGQPLLERQAERRRVELGRVLGWLGAHADRLEDPAEVARVARAVERAGRLVADVQRDTARAAEREVAGER